MTRFRAAEAGRRHVVSALSCHTVVLAMLASLAAVLGAARPAQAHLQAIGDTTFIGLNGRADMADISCVDAAIATPGANRRAVQVVYAVPHDVVSRSTTMIPQLRASVLTMGAFVDDQARRADGRQSARLRVRCLGGAIDVPSRSPRRYRRSCGVRSP